jgi:transcriptional regulator with XRE-family HTH domain
LFDIVNEVFDEGYSTEQDLKALLARNLRRARVARRLSLSELARATQLGKATLSEIEAQKANPTVETLRLLAQALRMPVGELLEDPDEDDIRLVRRPRGAQAASERRAVDRFSASGAIEVVELALPAHHHEDLAAGPPGAREELYVVQGSLVAGPPERATELSAGDWASFPADIARQFIVGRSATRALLMLHA